MSWVIWYYVLMYIFPISINILYRYLVQYIFLVSLAELLASCQHSAHLMASYRAGSLWKEIYIFETEENIGQDKQRDSNYSGEKMYTDRTNKVTAIIVDKKKCTWTGQTKRKLQLQILYIGCTCLFYSKQTLVQ